MSTIRRMMVVIMIVKKKHYRFNCKTSTQEIHALVDGRSQSSEVDVKIDHEENSLLNLQT